MKVQTNIKAGADITVNANTNVTVEVNNTITINDNTQAGQWNQHDGSRYTRVNVSTNERRILYYIRCVFFILTPYSQNIRTRLPTEGYTPIIVRAATCLPLHSHSYSASIEIAKAEGERRMDGKTLLAYITGSVDQELLLRNEYLVTENRILDQRAHLNRNLRF